VEAVAFPGAVPAAEDVVASAGVAAGKAKRNGKTFRIHGDHTNAISSFLSSAAAGKPPLHERKEGKEKGGGDRFFGLEKGKGRRCFICTQGFFHGVFLLARFIPPSYLNLVFSRHSSVSLSFLLPYLSHNCHFQKILACWQNSRGSSKASLLSA
jgi:hypothetical protein